jgi:hypothetical protein
MWSGDGITVAGKWCRGSRRKSRKTSEDEQDKTANLVIYEAWTWHE